MYLWSGTFSLKRVHFELRPNVEGGKQKSDKSILGSRWQMKGEAL
jgi:hypothetical protein